MNKFNDLIKKQANLLSEADPNLDPGLGGPPVAGSLNGPLAAPGPETGPDQVPQVTKLTPEGKRFLIELALKALAYDPHNLPDQDKAIFDEEVTPENAEDILNRIRSIVGGTDVEASDDTDTESSDAEDLG